MTIMNAIDPPEDQVADIARALDTLIAAGEQFRHAHAEQLHIGRNDLTVLSLLFDGGALTPRDISARMGMTSGTITPLLDRVEKAGFLTRNSNPEDRRSLLITITPTGRHALEWIYDQLSAAIREALAEIVHPDAKALATALEQLSSALGARTTAETDGNDSAPRRYPQTGPHPV